MAKPDPLLLLTAALGLALAGCGSSGAGHATTAARPPTTTAPQATIGPGATIRDVIENLRFNPATIHAMVGQKVQWVNRDGPPHNITYQSGPRFANSPRIIYPGHSYTITLTKPGVYRYYCSIHPFMRGTIVVTK
jgi:plastocyanin